MLVSSVWSANPLRVTLLAIFYFLGGRVYELQHHYSHHRIGVAVGNHYC